MLQSLADSTLRQYNVTFKLWWAYCQAENISPFGGETSHVIAFLQHQLDSTNNVYGSFNSHRAALSLIFKRNITEDIHLKRYMKGIFRTRPPKARYEHTWNPQQVFNYFRNSSDSTLKAVSSKAVTLLALATGQRLQTISLIKCANMHFSVSGLKIYIPDLIKTSRPNSIQPCLNLPYFHQDSSLCVASVIKEYLNMTKDIRNPSHEGLWLTIRKPHGIASKQTLSRWIKRTLQASGIDSSMFTPHSTRHASTSAAYRKGVPLEIIRNCAGWSQESSTFARFYNRPLVNSDEFFKTVFNVES